MFSGWGNAEKYQVQKNHKYVENVDYNKLKSFITRGSGRSYGDSSININNILSMESQNKIEYYDSNKGVISCGSGVNIDTVLKTVIKDGWMVPCCPGSRYISIGGMVASNTHGKDQHIRGTFKNFVIELRMHIGNNLITCSRTNNRDYFDKTIGSMGLTGIITSVKFKLKRISSSNILLSKKIYFSLKDCLDNLLHQDDSEYCYGWINFNKRNFRSVVFKGNYSLDNTFEYKNKKPLFIKIKFNLFFNNFIINIANRTYYLINKFSKSQQITSLEKFFFPLDRLFDWNNLYGSKGFFQIHFVVPIYNHQKCIKEIFDLINKHNIVLNLCVIKKFNEGKEKGMFSIEQEGFSIAIDMINIKKNVKFVEYLYDYVLENNCKLYLCKDKYVSKKIINKMYEGDIRSLKKFRDNFDIGNIESLQSRNLGLS